jgi:hypothetical protein
MFATLRERFETDLNCRWLTQIGSALPSDDDELIVTNKEPRLFISSPCGVARNLIESETGTTSENGALDLLVPSTGKHLLSSGPFWLVFFNDSLVLSCISQDKG